MPTELADGLGLREFKTLLGDETLLETTELRQNKFLNNSAIDNWC